MTDKRKPEGMVKPQVVSLALSVGFTVEAVKKWRQRGHVPAKHWMDLLRAARRRRVDLSPDDFIFTPTKGTATWPGSHHQPVAPMPGCPCTGATTCATPATSMPKSMGPTSC